MNYSIRFARVVVLLFLREKWKNVRVTIECNIIVSVWGDIATFIETADPKMQLENIKKSDSNGMHSKTMAQTFMYRRTLRMTVEHYKTKIYA